MHSQAMQSIDVAQIVTLKQVTQYWYINDYNQLPVNKIQHISDENWHKTTENNGSDLIISSVGTWYKIQLINYQQQDQDVSLVIDNRMALLEHKLFLQFNQSIRNQKLTAFRNNKLVSNLIIEPYAQVTAYIYLKASTPLNTRLTIYKASTFTEQTAKSHLYEGLAIGSVFCFGIVQIILFLGSRRSSYALLAGYFFTRTLLIAVMLGWNSLFIWPSMVDLKAAEIPFLISLNSIFLFLFTLILFDLKKLHQNLYKVIIWLCVALAIYMPLSLLFNVTNNFLISIVLYFCVVIILSIIALYLYQQHVRLAILLILICVLELFFITLVSIGFYWYQSGLFIYRNELISIGFLLNGWAFSYLISRQFFYETQDKILAQQQALASALKSAQTQEALLLAQQSNHEELEQHVQERTLELNIALQELEEANRELERKNMIDELTGLYNRRFYDHKILAEFRRSKRNLSPLSLVLIDIDFFKKINDQFGHIAGDYCLRQIAEQIKLCLKRDSDMGCRYGGEEFCLILPDTNNVGAVELAEILRKKVEKQITIYEDRSIAFTISCGVTTYQQQPDITPEQLFSAADKALYLAKKQGRNRVVVGPLTTSIQNEESSND
jgi:diguanylate cyclase (GGDEF)-like protein